MDRSNHYESAFEGYLQWHRLCYVAVDETRRSFLGDGRVKSLDFVVYGDQGQRYLVDVKGRRFPAGPPERPRRIFESWSPREDLDSLEQWAGRFGDDYVPLLVFLYLWLPETLPAEGEDLWTWQGRRYLLRAVRVDDYREEMQGRSPKWQTVMLPRPAYRRLVRPFHEFLRSPGIESGQSHG